VEFRGKEGEQTVALAGDRPGIQAGGGLGILGGGEKRTRNSCGPLFPVCTGNVRFVIPIFGRRITRWFQPVVIGLSAKRPGKSAMLSAPMARFGNAFPDWFAKPYRFQRAKKIIVEPSNISFGNSI